VGVKPAYPDRLRTGPAATFHLRPHLYVIQHTGGGARDGAIAVVPADATSTYAVYEGSAAALHGEEAGPVYSAGPDGPLAIPTGRVFVRLQDGVTPDTKRQAFGAAGFAIERTLPYAPNAAWLRPTEGGVAGALAGLSALENTPDVVHVEPQLLMQRVAR
jgi:hypothetical protein